MVTINLREMRINKKLTQKDVANALGVTQSAVAQWESAATQPRADAITILAGLYGQNEGAVLKAMSECLGTDELVGTAKETG